MVGMCINMKKKSKKNSDRLDFDYSFEKERKESRKKAKAWREKRKNVAFMKRNHDITSPFDGRVLMGSNSGGEGWDG